MTSGKARYNKPLTFAERINAGRPPEESQHPARLREIICGFFPGSDTKRADEQNNDGIAELWGDPAEAFANEVLTEVDWAMAMLRENRLSLTKADARAEADDLLSCLRETSRKLRRLSDDILVQLPLEADPLQCADEIDRLVKAAAPVCEKIAMLPQKPKPNEVFGLIADEFAIRVLRIAKTHGMTISSTSSQHYPGRTSRAALMLKGIGDEIGLDFDERTWCNRIAKIKPEAGDL